MTGLPIASPATKVPSMLTAPAAPGQAMRCPVPTLPRSPAPAAASVHSCHGRQLGSTHLARHGCQFNLAAMLYRLPVPVGLCLCQAYAGAEGGRWSCQR